MSAKACSEEEFKRYMCSYYGAKSILSEKEQLYIEEYFIKRKYEEELVELLGFFSSESNEFRTLKRSAIYKLADFLDLVVEKS